MQKDRIATDDLPGDETATIVAEAFKVSADYVRKLVTGVRVPKTEAGKNKARKIIRSYNLYRNGKSVLINKVNKLVKF